MSDRPNVHVLAGDEDDSAPTVGGPVLPPPITDEDVAEAVDGSLAAALRARYERARRRTQEFEVPGWDGGLIVVAKALRNRRQYEGARTEAFIARATEKLVLVHDDGRREEIPGGWGGELARIIGADLSGSKSPASDLVGIVLDNPARVDHLAAEILTWMAGATQQTEQDLGE